LLWDVRPQGLTGSKVEEVCNEAHLYVNKNTIAGDVSALSPGGVRIGSPCMTSRGLGESDFTQIADFLDRCAQIAIKIQDTHGKKIVDFRKGLVDNPDITKLRQEIHEFCGKFPIPGASFSA
jgi:glycine hydroxymethyltransferase